MIKVEIRVLGRIDPHWSEWLGGLSIEQAGESDVVLSGHVPDQASLYGIISRLRDMGLELLSVNSIPNGNSHNH